MGNQNCVEKQTGKIRQPNHSFTVQINQSINIQSEEIQMAHQLGKLEFDGVVQASKRIFQHPIKDCHFIKEGEGQQYPVSMPLPSISNCSANFQSQDYGRSQNLLECQNREKCGASDSQLFLADEINENSSLIVREENVFDYYRVIQKNQFLSKSSYKVESLTTGQPYLLKIVSKVSFRQKYLIHGQAQFQNLSILRHPNIIHLHEVFQDTNKYFIIFQYFQGTNLQQFIKNQGINDEIRRLIIKNILKVLNFMHCKGIVHRDIRLENVIICQNGNDMNFTVKLINFGLSINLNRKTIQKHIYGSIFYASPQSFDGIINEKYDIWSVGILTLILFAQFNPIANNTEACLFDIIRKGSFYKETLKRISQTVKQFVTELLVIKSRKRPSAEEALQIEWLSNQKGLYHQKRKKKISNIDQHLLLRC